MRAASAAILLVMKKRVAAALLWFYTGWVAGSLLTMVIGVSPVLGPILGIAAAALVAGDPRRVIWARSAAEQTRAIAMARTIRTPA